MLLTARQLRQLIRKNIHAINEAGIEAQFSAGNAAGARSKARGDQGAVQQQQSASSATSQAQSAADEGSAEPKDSSYDRWEKKKIETITSHTPVGFVTPAQIEQASLDGIAALATRSRGNTLLSEFLQQNPNAKIPIIRPYSLDTVGTIMAIEIHGLKIPSPEGFRSYALMASRFDPTIDFTLLSFTPGINGYSGSGVVNLSAESDVEEDVEVEVQEDLKEV